MTIDYIVDVNESDFEYEVIAFSQQIPVIVDFWAEWCAPCKVLDPQLESLAHEASGTFRLARVNVDENPKLAKQFTIYSLPTVKAFRNGQIVAEFVGLKPEPKLREFIFSLTPKTSDLALEKGLSLLKMHQHENAEEAFRQALEESPHNPTAMLGLTKSLLLQGYVGETRLLLRNFPASPEYKSAEILQPLVEALQRAEVQENDLDTLINLSGTDAAYLNALRLVRRGNIPAALDGLLDIIGQDKNYRDGEARKVFLALLELLGNEDQLARQYRNELASILF